MEGVCTNDSRLIIGGEIQPEGTELRRIVIAAVYLLIAFISIPVCMFDCSVFCRKPYISQSCYKLLSLITLLDVLNLVNNALVPGFLSLFNVTPCNGGAWTLFWGYYHILIWTGYCAVSEVLAVNRVIIFVSKKWSAFLFDEWRTWLWLFTIAAYVAGCVAWVPDAKYIYDPNAGVIYDWKVPISSNSLNSKPLFQFNPMHTFNNFFKIGFLTIAYLIMLGFILYRIRSSGVKKESSQIRVISLLSVLLSRKALPDISPNPLHRSSSRYRSPRLPNGRPFSQKLFLRPECGCGRGDLLDCPPRRNRLHLPLLQPGR
ncbi:hypothetical protein L596_012882 [Steinernema carpocapsae]|uniref:G-protein coupled receptors family 1 profile domain-containing protein n=1 Tax=Steinernema carpocapsae TaxID=34508 RepID=A0A4U5NYK4_STECR|nr:hypothetical protein L596_012882 [Steinernema carpocapsae]